jgi:nucleoside-diphosphate-sugar epimerase
MKLNNQNVVICGAGGFIGGHLVNRLLKQGIRTVRAVDVKPLDEWCQKSPEAENLVMDLREKEACYQAAKGMEVVFQLAADMGGM